MFREKIAGFVTSLPGIGRWKRHFEELFQRVDAVEQRLLHLERLEKMVVEQLEPRTAHLEAHLKKSFNLLEYRVDQIYRNVIAALMAKHEPVMTMMTALDPANTLPLREVFFREAEAVRIDFSHSLGEPDSRFAFPVTEAEKEYFAAHRRRFEVTLDLLASLKDRQDGFSVVADLATSPFYHPGLRQCFPSSQLIFVGSGTGHAGPVRSDDRQDWIRDLDLESDPVPLPDDSVDLVLCLEVLEHFVFDPMHALKEINRILKPGGTLFLSTPNLASWKAAMSVLTGYSPLTYGKYSASRQRGTIHVREWVPGELEILCRAAGLDAAITTQNVYHTATPDQIQRILQATGVSNNYSGDTIFVLATKVGPVEDRYPSQFYCD
jgi:SAM-dependent methyltransferase